MRKLKTDEILRLTKHEAKRSPRHPIVCVLEDVRSIHNVGSMFRTAEAGGIGHLYLAGITGTPENRMIHKAALGAEDIVEWSHDRSVADILTSLKQSGYTIAALEQTDSPTAISEFGGDAFPLALVVGNEVTGVSESALELCDVAVEIEQFGAKHSLNVAVAFGICLFRIVDRFRQVREVPFHPTVPTHP